MPLADRPLPYSGARRVSPLSCSQACLWPMFMWLGTGVSRSGSLWRRTQGCTPALLSMMWGRPWHCLMSRLWTRSLPTTATRYTTYRSESSIYMPGHLDFFFKYNLSFLCIWFLYYYWGGIAILFKRIWSFKQNGDHLHPSMLLYTLHKKHFPKIKQVKCWDFLAIL